MKPRALYYSIMSYLPEPLALLHGFYEVRTLRDPRDDTAAELAEVEVLCVPLGFRVDAAKIANCPRLRAIVSNTTGVPHIDMVAAARRQIAVCALHDEQLFLDSITPTAEHTIGLMLAAWRRIPAAHAAASAGAWDRLPWPAPRMFSRLRLGIVGFGRLGRKVAAIGKAMGMEVAYYDPYVPGGVPSLLALAARSDVLSLHAPATSETQGLVSRAVLAALPRGALLVNTARGELLDEEALLNSLESGHLWAAALDTISGEYDPAFSASFGESRLAAYARTHDNLVLTPHIGGSTTDAWRETQEFVVRKSARALGLAGADR